MSCLRPHLFLPLPLFLPRLYPRLSTPGLHSSASSTPGLKSPNPALDLDPALQALLKDTDISNLRAKTHLKSQETSVDKPLYTPPHRELEVINNVVEHFEIPTSDVARGNDNNDLFPRSVRKSPAASFGSRGIGAVVLPFELQGSISRLISGAHSY